MNLRERWSAWVSRIGVTLFLLATLALGLALSAVFFAVLLGMAVFFGGWLWWQSWRMRRQFDKAARAHPTSRHSPRDFIDADYEVEVESQRLEDLVSEKSDTRQATQEKP